MEVVRILGAMGRYPGEKDPEYEHVFVELPEEVFAIVVTEPGRESVTCIPYGTWATFVGHGLVPGEFAVGDRSKKLAKQIVDGLTSKPKNYAEALKARAHERATYKPIEESILRGAEEGYKQWLKDKNK